MQVVLLLFCQLARTNDRMYTSVCCEWVATPLTQGAVLKKEKKKRIDPTSQRPSASPLVWIFVRVFVVSHHHHPPDTKTNFAQKVDSCLCNGSSWWSMIHESFPPVCYCRVVRRLFLPPYDAHSDTHSQHSWLNLESSVIHYWKIHHSTPKERNAIEKNLLDATSLTMNESI